VCSLHRAQGDRERDFLRSASKPRSMVSPSLASKPVAIVLVVWPQNHSLEFSGLGFKIGSCGLATVSWFGPQKQEGYGLLVAPQNQWEDEDGTGHVSIFSGMLCLEVSRARVSQVCLKLVKDRQQVEHVASSQRSHGCETKDGRFNGVGCGAVEVGPNYPSLDVIFRLAYRGIIVFRFSINGTPRVGGEVSIQPSLFHPLSIVAF
jgi:hypothetical protein